MKTDGISELIELALKVGKQSGKKSNKGILESCVYQYNQPHKNKLENTTGGRLLRKL